MSVPLPQYGNFGGNGDNDAWAQANRYITWVYNGHSPPPTTGAPGSKSVDVPPSHFTPYWFTPGTGANITVRQILRDMDRVPINDVDMAYLNHDLGYVPDSYIANFQNNIDMGQNVYQAITAGNGGLDWNAYVYGTASVPFIGFAGSAHSLFEEIAADLEQPLGVLVDEVVVVAGQQYSQTIDVYYTLYDAGVSVASGLFNAATQIWNGFTSAIGATYSSLADALSGAWAWLRGFNEENRAANSDLGPLDLSTLEVTSWSVGEQVAVSDLGKLDSDGDGLLTADDRAFTFVGLRNAEGEAPIRLSGSDIISIDLDPSDNRAGAHDATEGLIVLEAFGVIQPAGTASPIGLAGGAADRPEDFAFAA
jgi:hypothetical protein